METVLETPLKNPVQSENPLSDYKTPPPNQETAQKIQNSANDSGNKTATPDRLKVPKAFKFPERYRSPTDLMISPVSKGLLARSRKTGSLLPPAKIQPKVQDLRVQEVGLFQA